MKSAKQLLKSNPIQAAKFAEFLKPQLFCVIIGSAVGDSEFIPCTTLNQCSAAYRAFLNENDLGSRDAGSCYIYSGNKIVAHVSYNGKVWEGEHYILNAEPLFKPAPFEEKICAS